MEYIWTNTSCNWTQDYLLWQNKDDPHEKGVGFLLKKVAKKALLVLNHTSERIILARFDTRFKRITVLQTYAPINEVDEEEKENFYSFLKSQNETSS